MQSELLEHDRNTTHMSEASGHTHKSTRPFSIISCDDANTQQTHNRHMHTHFSFLFAEIICDSPKSPGSALVAQSIASRITAVASAWCCPFSRSYGLQLDERASTMVLGSAGGPPRGLAVFALLLHEADRSFDAAMPTSSRWRPRGTPDACSKPQAAGNMVARCESEHVELEPRKIFPVHEGAGCTNDTCRNLKATKRILPQPLVARHVQTLRRSAHASS